MIPQKNPLPMFNYLEQDKCFLINMLFILATKMCFKSIEMVKFDLSNYFSLLEFILICFALILLLRRLAPLIIRFFFGRLFKMAQKQQNQYQQQKTTNNSKKSKTSSDNLGEYIDYEEID